MQALTIGHMITNRSRSLHASNVRFHCGHSTYLKIVPSIGDIILCRVCNSYQMVWASGSSKWVAYCNKGNNTTSDPRHECYAVHCYTDIAKAELWANSHKHDTTIEYRGV